MIFDNGIQLVEKPEPFIKKKMITILSRIVVIVVEVNSYIVFFHNKLFGLQ